MNLVQNDGLTLEQAVSVNPYTPDTPVRERQLFFGREELVEYVRSLVLGDTVRRPLLLHGDAGMGKTSVLIQVETGILDPLAVAVRVDLSLLSRKSLPAFIWDMATSANQSLRRQRRFWLEPGRLDRVAFLEDPGYALDDHLIRPLLDKAALPLLLLLDRADVLVGAAGSEPVAKPFLDCLHDLSQRHQSLHLILAVDGPTLPLLSYLGNPHYYQLGPLSYEATAALIREPAPYHIFDNVCQLIWQATNGHPGHVQQVCHALFNWRQERGLRQIMVVDVMEVLRQELTHLYLPLASNQRMIPYHQP
jgi:hypothetical protein